MWMKPYGKMMIWWNVVFKNFSPNHEDMVGSEGRTYVRNSYISGHISAIGKKGNEVIY